MVGCREKLVSRRTALRNWINRYLAHETWEDRSGLWSVKGQRRLQALAAQLPRVGVTMEATDAIVSAAGERQVSPLAAGDKLTRAEYSWRWEAHWEIKNASRSEERLRDTALDLKKQFGLAATCNSPRQYIATFFRRVHCR